MSDTLESHLVHERRNRPDGPSPVDLVSVQSQLAYGYAGNSAAVPVLRMLGARVAEVPTTLLSNTPFYATLRGRVLPADWLADVLRGLDPLPRFARDAVGLLLGVVLEGAHPPTVHALRMPSRSFTPSTRDVTMSAC